eukprot:729631-Prymnesium_polylepis.2
MRQQPRTRAQQAEVCRAEWARRRIAPQRGIAREERGGARRTFGVVFVAPARVHSGVGKNVMSCGGGQRL